MVGRLISCQALSQQGFYIVPGDRSTFPSRSDAQLQGWRHHNVVVRHTSIWIWNGVQNVGKSSHHYWFHTFTTAGRLRHTVASTLANGKLSSPWVTSRSNLNFLPKLYSSGAFYLMQFWGVASFPEERLINLPGSMGDLDADNRVSEN